MRARVSLVRGRVNSYLPIVCQRLTDVVLHRDGHYGLYLDESLFDGSSAPCPTFDNEPLCSGTAVGNMKTVKFECVGLEVWGMG